MKFPSAIVENILLPLCNRMVKQTVALLPAWLALPGSKDCRGVALPVEKRRLSSAGLYLDGAEITEDSRSRPRVPGELRMDGNRREPAFTRPLWKASLLMTTKRRIKIGRHAVLCVFLTLAAAVCRKGSAQCIPVESEVVRSTCGGCHQVDARHCMSRISGQRKTPEGWEDTIRRMGRTNGVPSSASQAREIIGYLAASQGLSSSEVQDIAYALEKRRNVVENVPNEDVKNACTRCHSYARIAGERRTREEWLKLKDFHLATFPEELNSPEWPPSADKAMNYLAQRFPLHTPEWERERNEPPLGQGSWTIWGHEPGRGDYIGTMSIAPGKDGTYQSRTSLEFAGGEREERNGEGVCYGGYAWRGSTRSSDGRKIREVFELSPDRTVARGRWFLEEQPEIGGEEERSLETGPSRIIGVLPRALKIPTTETSITIVGDPSAYWPGASRPSPGQQYQGYFHSQEHQQPGRRPHCGSARRLRWAFKT